MAVDQIALMVPEPRFREGSAFTATAHFRTRATSAATTPTTIHYRLDCLTTCTELADWTSVSASTNVSIAITATHNSIQSNGNARERKQLSVMTNMDLPTQCREAVSWIVENLYGSP